MGPRPCPPDLWPARPCPAVVPGSLLSPDSSTTPGYGLAGPATRHAGWVAVAESQTATASWPRPCPPDLWHARPCAAVVPGSLLSPDSSTTPGYGLAGPATLRAVWVALAESWTATACLARSRARRSSELVSSTCGRWCNE